MAGPDRRTHPALSVRLHEQAQRFEFSQLVRLVELAAAQGAWPEVSGRDPLGFEPPVRREALRLRAHAALTFPDTEVVSLTLPDAGDGAGDDPRMPRQPHAEVGFMGLTGPQGVLPTHYTTRLIERQFRGDPALRDFLDLFNHRILSLFFRAGEKYRFGHAYVRAHRHAIPERDVFTLALRALVGLATPGLQGRHDFDDEVFCHYGGHFSQRRPSADALQALLRDYFQVPLRVEQYVGHWLSLSPDDRTRLGAPPESSTHGRGQFSRLGRGVVLGGRVWDVNGKFRLRIGPLDRETFDAFLPGADRLVRLVMMTRTFVRADLAFEVQLVLRQEEVPDLQLGTPGSARLGYNTWLAGRSRLHDGDEPRFQER